MTDTQDRIESIDLTPSPRILEMIAEVDLAIYQCLAEFVDNAFDELSKAKEEDPDQEHRVDIQLPTSGKADRSSEIVVADTGRGMTTEQMRTALRAGSSGNQAFGSLGLFGMGFNVATARLGRVTEVRSGRKGDDTWVIATIDLAEMQRMDSYRVPLRHAPKDRNEHGTTITVKELKTDIVAKLQRQGELNSTKKMLGRIYSYILRDPARRKFSGSGVIGGLGLPLYLNGNAVKPVIPCVWDPDRTVTNKGRVVNAVQAIDFPLGDAYACMTCGHWHTNPHDRCAECGSENVVQRERRIHGWLGVQRYNHTSDFGVSFIRQGRSITHQDKGLFNFQDEDTIISEYPIEIGGGRLVGEIHLDHAPVNFRKTDFDRDSRSWSVMLDRIRGSSPLRPKKAQELGMPANDSPLAVLFDAFRRNDPGLKCLVPGNGKAALHDQARKWGEEFRRETPGYETDQKWYEAAKEHDDIVAGVKPTNEGAADDDLAWLEAEGLGHLDLEREGDPSADDTGHTGSGVEPRAPETVDERFARYGESSRPLPDIEGEVRLGSARLKLRGYVTSGIMFDPADGGSRYFVLRAVSGETLLFVAEETPLVRDFGWSPSDAALVYAVPFLKDVYRLPGTHLSVLDDLVAQFPDRRVNPAAVRDRGVSLLDDLRERLAPIIAGNPSGYWSSLRSHSRTEAEDLARASSPDMNWERAIEDGSFASYLTAGGIEDLIRAYPADLLDHAVFRSTYSTWSDDATRAEQVDRLVGLVQDLRRITAAGPVYNARELNRFSLSVDLLRSELID